MELTRKILPWLMVMMLMMALFSGCRNMPEEYVYGGKISGTAILIGVIDNNYAGISVHLSSSVITSSLTTTSTGGFAFTDLPDGTYSLDCTKGGYATENVSGIVIEKSNSWSGTVYLTPDAPPSPPAPD